MNRLQIKKSRLPSDPIHITVDDRETKSGVIKSLSEIQNVNIDIRRLPLGDYQIGHQMIVERKTLNDFAISIVDGRLFRQMIGLANAAFQGVLILEGTAADIANLKMTRASMQGALITVSLIYGIPILRAHDYSETARLILYIGHQLKSITKGGIQRHGYPPKGYRKRQLYILQGLPGIGPERASRLLNRFQSVEAVFTASSEELQSVKGISNGIAEKIRWLVTEEIKSGKDIASGS